MPTSRREIDSYLMDVRPQLRFDERTHTVLQALLSQPAPNLAMRPFGDLTMRAAIDLLPPWARVMLELRERPAEGPLVRAGARGVGVMLRWALNGRNAEAQARRG